MVNNPISRERGRVRGGGMLCKFHNSIQNAPHVLMLCPLTLLSDFPSDFYLTEMRFLDAFYCALLPGNATSSNSVSKPIEATRATLLH